MQTIAVVRFREGWHLLPAGPRQQYFSCRADAVRSAVGLVQLARAAGLQVRLLVHEEFGEPRSVDVDEVLFEAPRAGRLHVAAPRCAARLRVRPEAARARTASAIEPVRRPRLMRGGHARGAMAALLIFATACVIALLVGPGRNRPAPAMDARPQAPAASVDLAADAAMAPLEDVEGAAGTVARANAGGAVNPITPTGDAGGPAGQTPAYGQPGGAPSRVVRP